MSGLKTLVRLLRGAGPSPGRAEGRQARRRQKGGASAWRKNATYSVNLAGRHRMSRRIFIAPEGRDQSELASHGPPDNHWRRKSALFSRISGPILSKWVFALPDASWAARCRDGLAALCTGGDFLAVARAARGAGAERDHPARSAGQRGRRAAAASDRGARREPAFGGDRRRPWRPGSGRGIAVHRAAGEGHHPRHRARHARRARRVRAGQGGADPGRRSLSGAGGPLPDRAAAGRGPLHLHPCRRRAGERPGAWRDHLHLVRGRLRPRGGAARPAAERLQPDRRGAAQQRSQRQPYPDRPRPAGEHERLRRVRTPALPRGRAGLSLSARLAPLRRLHRA